MNEMSLYGEKRMTVREVAEAFGVSDRTIQRHLKDIRGDLDNVVEVENGKASYLSEAEATEIKRRIERSGRNDLMNVHKVSQVTTALEIEEMTIKVLSYHKAEADRLRAELEAAAPKIEAANALMASEQTMSITDAAKHFGMHPKTQVFPYLREHGYLTARDIPTQAAIDAGYLSLREARCADGEVRRQAVVLAGQLDTWRVRVIPQVQKWCLT